MTTHAPGIPPPTALDLVGPVGLAKMKGLRRARLDDLRYKGLVPEPDAVVSGTPLWRRARIDQWNPDDSDWSRIAQAGQLPKLVGTREMAALFGLSQRTPDGWRYRRILPVEDCYVEAVHPARGTPVWVEHRIITWAAYTHPYVFDRPTAQIKLDHLPEQLQEVVRTRYRQPAAAG